MTPRLAAGLLLFAITLPIPAVDGVLAAWLFVAVVYGQVQAGSSQTAALPAPAPDLTADHEDNDQAIERDHQRGGNLHNALHAVGAHQQRAEENRCRNR